MARAKWFYDGNDFCRAEERGKSVSWLLGGCLGKYLNLTSSWLISTHLFYLLLLTNSHTIYYSNKNAIFTISRNDHDSCRRRHGACYSYFAFAFVFVFGGVVFREERVLCVWISLKIDRDGLKTNSTNQQTSFCLSLFLGRRRRALWRPTTNIIQTRRTFSFSIVYG